MTAVPAVGYSGTPLAAKLGIRPQARVVLVGAPADAGEWLEPLPEGAQVSRAARGRDLDVIVVFTRRRDDLERRIGALLPKLAPAGGLWVAWPKKAAGVATDLTENVVREVGLAAGVVDNKVCAVTDVWSGLRFVRRLRDR